MARVSIWLLVLSIFFFNSCIRTEKIQSVEFSGNREQILREETAELDITIFDTLIFLHKYSSANFFSVYSKDQKLIKGDWLKNGNGPGEFTAPKFIKQIGTQKLFVYDIFKGGLFQLKPDNPDLEIDFVSNLDPVFGLTQDMILKNDSILIGNLGYLSPEAYLVKGFDFKNQKDLFLVPIPDLAEYENKGVSDFYTVFYNFFRMKPDGSKSVLAFNYFDRMLILDEDFQLKKEVLGATGLKSLKIVEGEPVDLVNYYFDLEVTDDYIFALYYDQPESQYGEVMQSTQIRIFDWNGTLLNIIEVPDYLMGISFDEKNQTIYGVDHFQEKIVKYDFSELLKELD